MDGQLGHVCATRGICNRERKIILIFHTDLVLLFSATSFSHGKGRNELLFLDKEDLFSYVNSRNVEFISHENQNMYKEKSFCCINATLMCQIVA